MTGGLLAGDAIKAGEFYIRARSLLDDVLNQTDYKIAQVRQIFPTQTF